VTAVATTEPATCACGTTYKPGAAFCARCGTRRQPVEPVAPPPPRAAGLPIAIAYYMVLLAAQVVAMVNIKLGGDVFTTTWVVTLGFAVITIGFAIPNHALVLPLLGRAGFRPLGYLVLLALAPVIVALIHGYVHGLGILFDLDQPGELDMYAGYGIGLAIVLDAVIPPFVEEIGFRGLIFGALRRNLRFSEALVISSFAFAFAHLSVPSILTHAPLGFYLCWLRYRSNSLWPPMFAHACHNLGVIAWAAYST